MQLKKTLLAAALRPRGDVSCRKNDLYGIYEGFLLPNMLGLMGARQDAQAVPKP